MRSLRTRKSRVRHILETLRRTYPDARCSLDHGDAWQLLVATILSAQCTDARVNKVTPGLFEQFPTPRDFAEAPIVEIEEAIRSTGFYRNKARSIQGAARALVARAAGDDPSAKAKVKATGDARRDRKAAPTMMPDTMAGMLELPGVGRKTANVVLGEVYDAAEGVVVDTHVARITRKLGLTDQTDPVKIERQLDESVPAADRRDFGHLLIEHGRKICRARAPLCDECPIYRWCDVRA
jgi:endonuclease-3